MWLTAHKGATPVNYTSTTDWQMAVRWDNVIRITLRQVYQRRLYYSDTLLLIQVATQLYSRD